MKEVRICDADISNNVVSFSKEEFFTIKTFVTGLLDESPLPLILYNFENQYSGREVTAEECWDLLYLLKESDVIIPGVIRFMKLLEFVSLAGGRLII